LRGPLVLNYTIEEKIPTTPPSDDEAPEEE
jgi:hypothetical protein